MRKPPASGTPADVRIGAAHPTSCSAPITTLDAFAAAWNTHSAEARQRYLTLALCEGARFTDPVVDIIGRTRIARHMAACQARYPGSRWLVSSSVRLRASILVFEWSWLHQGSLLLTGWSGAELGSGERFACVASSFRASAPTFSTPRR